MSHETNPLPPDELPQLAQERLSIAHLLLWTLGTAVALAFFRSFFEGSRGAMAGREDMQLAERIFAILKAPFYGAAIASVPYVGWQLGRGKKNFPTQPGHWLLLAMGVSILASIVAVWANPVGEIAVYRIFARREFWRSLPTIVVTIAALLQFNQARWRWMFGLMAVGYAAGVALYGLSAISSIPDFSIAFYNLATVLLWLFQTLSVFMLIYCILADRTDRLPRDFLHTTGVVVRFAIIAFGWITPWVDAFLWSR